MKIRIEGGGHCVEADCPDVNMDFSKLAEITEAMWTRTKTERPSHGLGFGSQLVERSSDRPVAGEGAYQRQPDPVTS